MTQYITLPKQAKDITNQRFGRLIALGPSGQASDDGMIWYCQCDCGNRKHIRIHSLTSGGTTSCGCLQKEAARRTKTTHGFASTRNFKFPYSTWANMITRCTNPKASQYANYGGRGITVHDGWHNSFEVFQEYVSKLPHYGDKGYTLDRIDNNGNYEPGNVKWSSRKEQARNKTNSRLITYNGKTQCLSAWVEEVSFAVSAPTVIKRIKAGWTVEQAFFTPSRTCHKRQ